MKGLLFPLSLLCAVTLSAQTHIHSFSEIGARAGDPAVCDASRSSLEKDYRTSVVLGEETLGQQMLDYGRVKKLRDGSYILFYQPLKHGYHIYCSLSSDCIHWTRGQRVFEGGKFKNGDGEEDDHKYATADAVQLENGDILCFCIFHSQKHYGKHLGEFGLSMKRSSDGGRTWGPEQVLHTSVDWEPYPMVLPDGEILVFFTDSDWDWDPNSSGCSLLRSKDGGYTWTLQQQAIRQVRGKAVAAQRSVGTPRLKPDSTRTVFTDQMPVVRILRGTETAMAVTETETPDHQLSVSLAWEDYRWPVTLTGEMAGPRKRVKSAFEGSGPYLVQFPSGETVVSYGFAGDFAVRLGGSTGEDIPSAAPLFPFGFRTSRWGSLEIVGPTTLAAVTTWLYRGSNVERGKLMLTQMHLNRSVEAPSMPVKADGKNDEWEGVRQVLFLGSDTPAQCCLRFAHDAGKVYVLAECLDEELSNGDGLTLMFSDGSSKGSIRMAFADVSGKARIIPSPGCKGVAYTSRKEGYIAEFAIDKTSLPVSSDGRLYFNAVLYKGDVTDTFDGIGATEVNKWIPIVLK